MVYTIVKIKLKYMKAKWKNNKFHGQGISYDENGDKEFEGKWVFDKLLNK